MEDALTARASGKAPARAKARPLDRDGLEALLAAFHPNRTEAAERYGALRDRLSRFFDWNHSTDPDALADEVMDRLARRAASEGGDAESIRHPEKFAIGVARLLLREQWRDRVASERMTAALSLRHANLGRQMEDERRTELAAGFLESCLTQLPAAQRELIQRYYSTESRTQTEARKTLATEFNISLNALRNRALRIREELEQCVRNKLEQHSS